MWVKKGEGGDWINADSSIYRRTEGQRADDIIAT